MPNHPAIMPHISSSGWCIILFPFWVATAGERCRNWTEICSSVCMCVGMPSCWPLRMTQLARNNFRPSCWYLRLNAFIEAGAEFCASSLCPSPNQLGANFFSKHKNSDRTVNMVGWEWSGRCMIWNWLNWGIDCRWESRSSPRWCWHGLWNDG